MVASSTDVIHVWDLRRIRRQLAPMGLDWDLPSDTTGAEAESPEPLKVEVLLHEPKDEALPPKPEEVPPKQEAPAGPAPKGNE